MKGVKNQSRPNNFSTSLCILFMTASCLVGLLIGPECTALAQKLSKPESSLSDLIYYFIKNLPFIICFLILLICSNLFLKTTFRQILAGTKLRYRNGYALVVGCSYFGLLCLLTLTDLNHIKINPTPLLSRLIFFVPILAVVLAVSISEEIFFRALPARILFKNKLPSTWGKIIVASLISGIMYAFYYFSYLKMNNQAYSIGLVFCSFLWSFLAMSLGLYTNGFEAPLTMNIVKDFYLAFIINKGPEALSSEAIFLNTSSLTPIVVAGEILFLFGGMYLLSFTLKKMHGNVIPGKEATKKAKVIA